MRRESGLISSPAGLGLHDHVCWTYDDDGARGDAVAAWLRDGLALGQRVVNVAGADPDDQRGTLGALGDVEGLAARGALDLVAVGEVYAAGRGVDPDEQLRVYAAATERARADGFSGLRVAAEITPLLTDRAGREAFSRWELAADRYCATAPFAAMCCVDRRVVGEADLVEIACAHPLVHGPPRLAPFRLRARPGGLSVEGEVDAFCAGVLQRLLEAALPEGPCEVDLAGVEFIEHNGLLAIDRTVRGRGAVEVRGLPEAARRLCGLLSLPL